MLMAIVVMKTIDLQLSGLCFLLVALRREPFVFLVAVIVCRLVLTMPLSLNRMPTVEWSWFAIGTRMIEIFSRGILYSPGIETFNMLPCIARLTVYRISIVVRVIADTFNGVRFLVYRLGNWDNIVGRN